MAAYDPVYLSLSDDPLTIVGKMDEFQASRHKALQANDRRKRIPLFLAFAGVGLVGFDLFFFWLLLRYNVCLLTPVAVICWIAAIVIAIALRKARLRSLAPAFTEAREIIYTLRDDIKPGSGFLGHVDLTGLEQQSKIAREVKDELGRTNRLYMDPWLNLKLKMYDGNILRLSAVERTKTRLGYWKRGQISGKNKWKPDKFKGRVAELKMRLAVNPEVYEISLQPELRLGAMVGEYAIAQADGNGGILTVIATTSGEPKAVDILNVMRVAYNSLKRKVTA